MSEVEHERWIDRDHCRKERTAAAGRRLLAEAARDTDADEATFWLVSDDRAHLDGTLNHGNPEVLEHVSVPIGDSVIGMVASTGIGTSVGPKDWKREIEGGGQVDSMIVSPVIIDHRMCGVVSAVRLSTEQQTRGEFGEEDLDTLQWKAFLLGLILGQDDE